MIPACAGYHTFGNAFFNDRSVGFLDISGPNVTETFEHTPPLITLYIMLPCDSRYLSEGLGTQKSPIHLIYLNWLCSKVS